MRTTFVVIAVIAVATLLSELLGVAFLWYRGQLTEQTISDIRLILSGEVQFATKAEQPEPRELPSSQDYRRRRTMRVLGLNTREQELELLQSMVAANRRAVIEERQALQKKKEQFEERLRRLGEQTGSEAAEQARAILRALQPADAAEQLMALTTEQNVLLLKNMSERTVAKILEEMLQGDDQQRERGRQIFEAITEGDPAKSLVGETLDQVSGETAASAN